MTPAVRHYTMLFRQREPNRPMLECYWMARRHVHFLGSTKKYLGQSRKRKAA
jgi:hypothetical protein